MFSSRPHIQNFILQYESLNVDQDLIFGRRIYYIWGDHSGKGVSFCEWWNVYGDSLL